MILLATFKQVDHPLIIIAQIVGTFFLFQLFFLVRKNTQPLPQIIAGLAFGMLANVVGRSMHKDWFWVADVVQYVTLAAVIIASVRAARKAKKEAAQRPGAAVVVADVFDRFETRVTWVLGLILAGGLTYYCIDLYMQLEHKDAQVITAATKAKTEATVQFSEQLCKTEQNQTALYAAVTSISATQGTLLASQSKIIANQAKNSTKILSGQKDVKATVLNQSRNAEKAPRATVTQADSTSKSKPDNEAEPQKDQNLWRRFKGLFRTSARRDSLSSDPQIMPYDTLVYQ